uniref:Uncharacterized protein n=1 Tax=Candidatus Kentrum sp. TC TaxID=2126339 RepID=A0A450ZK93_9GAMM|nr:MAG: hypothetical protein BECKTC1821F_GA0114240_100476 [Candidatus Kentron sp. TC]
MSKFYFRNDALLPGLRELYEKRRKTIENLKRIYESSLPVLSSIVFGDMSQELEIGSLQKALKEIDMQIAVLVKHEHLNHLQSVLKDFKEHYPDPDRHVFVMMKFPKGDLKLKKDQILDAIFKKIEDVCQKKFGLIAIRADKLHVAHNSIWENAQVHALGCSYGIAILESKYTNEFNPNVAMEAGFMEAIGHQVLLLVEETFSHDRADIHGRLRKPFRWGNSEDELGTIDKSITEWLDNQKVARKPGSC